MVPEIWSKTDIIFCHFGPFFTLLPSKKKKPLKNRNFEKMKKKIHGDIIILHSVSKIMIICHTVPEIQRMTDVIFTFHFRHHHFTHVHQKL